MGICEGGFPIALKGGEKMKYVKVFFQSAAQPIKHLEGKVNTWIVENGASGADFQYQREGNMDVIVVTYNSNLPIED